jgi:hypothetical protein
MEPIALLTAVVVLGTAVVGYMAAKQRQDSSELLKSVQEVHVMVNDRMSEALARIDQLDEALRTAGIAVPAKPDR